MQGTDINISKNKKANFQAWIVWIIANMMVIFASSSQVAYAYINTSLSHELNLNISQIAMVSSFYTWVFAVCQFFSGYALTQFGIRKVFLFLTSMILFGFFIFINASSLPFLFLAQFFIALGASFGFVGAGYTGGVWFGFHRYGAMFSLTQSFASSGAFLSGILYAYLVDIGKNWNEVLFMIACYGITVFMLIVFFVKDAKEFENPSCSSLGLDFFRSVLISLIEGVKVKLVWVSAICGGISFGVFLSFSVLWCPKLLMAIGFSEVDAGWLTSLNWVGIAFGCIFISKISEIFKNRRIVFSSASLFQTVFLLILIILDIQNIYFVGLFIFLFGASASSQMLTFTMAGESVEDSLVGTTAAIVNGAMFIFTGFIMALIGQLLKGSSYQDVLLVLPLLLVFASGFIFVAKESFGGALKSSLL